ncbi:MAG: DUF1552 domain-containing protein [Myxococcales bacterium]|nr:DUF1552 domain-containing protein [Myxococcales bacterium]
MNRRQLLTALGLTSSGLFLPSLSRGASAPPTRFLLLYTAQGAVPDRWVCNPEGRPIDVDWGSDWTSWAPADFSDSLRPLHPWREQTLAVGGLSLLSAEADGDGHRHERAQAHSLTGADAAWVGGFPYSGDATIDQRVADAISRSDRYRSLELSVAGGLSYDGFGSAIYRGRTQPLPPIDDPRVLWDRLFGFAGGGGDPVLAAQGSVLDAVSGRYGSVAAQLSGEDRRKLEVHRDLVRTLELQIAGLADHRCDLATDRPTSAGAYDADFEAHLGLITAALACDLTRVVSIQMGQLTTQQLGLPPGDLHAEYAHEIYARQSASDAMASYIAYHAEHHFTRILAALDAIPEGSGTLLDNTVVLWMSEMADSWHGFDQYPVVIGGGGSRFRLGRYLHYASNSPFIGLEPVEDRTMGIPHQRFLRSVAVGMGMAPPQLGVTEVEGWDGTRIDCTELLQEML